MKDRNAMLTEIQEALGSACTREDAERVYTSLRNDERIYYADDQQGLALRAGVNLLAAASQVLAVHPHLALIGRLDGDDNRLLMYEGMTVEDARTRFEHDLREWAKDSELPPDHPIHIDYVLTSTAPMLAQVDN
jgi:hypothetical protein